MSTVKKAFEGYIGNADLVRKGIRSIRTFNNSAFGEVSGLSCAFSAIIYGPPGTGKTLFITELFKYAKENSNYEWKLFEFHPGDILSRFVNQTAEQVQAFFQNIRDWVSEDSNKRRAFVFFDEFDVMAGARGNGSKSDQQDDKAVGIMLQDISGPLRKGNVNGPKLRDYCFMLAATNHIEKIDPAIIRPGRFDAKWEMNYIQEVDQTVNLFNVFLTLNNVANEVRSDFLSSIASIYSQTNQVTPAFVEAVVKDAYREASYDYEEFKSPAFWNSLVNNHMKSAAKKELQSFFDERHLLTSFKSAFVPLVRFNTSIDELTKQALISSLSELEPADDPSKLSFNPDILQNFDQSNQEAEIQSQTEIATCGNQNSRVDYLPSNSGNSGTPESFAELLKTLG
jgi:SpoVK/Ycf46/Vps4 family AAA+-type ATPase